MSVIDLSLMDYGSEISRSISDVSAIAPDRVDIFGALSSLPLFTDCGAVELLYIDRVERNVRS